MYKLNYNKVTKKMFDISLEEKKYFDSIDISEEDKKIILEQLNNNNKCFINIENNTYYFKKYFNACEMRCEIESLRDKLLVELEPFFTERYQLRLASKGLLIDNEYFILINDYYDDLLDVLQDFDNCSDQENFVFIFVDVKEEYADECVSETIKPYFVK